MLISIMAALIYIPQWKEFLPLSPSLPVCFPDGSQSETKWNLSEVFICMSFMGKDVCQTLHVFVEHFYLFL
jgi:hypothetical protein